jgi:hypothetical protein
LSFVGFDEAIMQRKEPFVRTPSSACSPLLGTLYDSLQLRPAFMGVGFDLKPMLARLIRKKSKTFGQQIFRFWPVLRRAGLVRLGPFCGG